MTFLGNLIRSLREKSICTGRPWAVLWGLLFAGVGCDGPSPPSSSLPILRVGVTAGPHEKVMSYVKQRAKQEGLSLEILVFEDFLAPNRALAEGSLDVNCYQHTPFLKDQEQQYGYAFESVGSTLLMPMGIYSTRWTQKTFKNPLETLPLGAQVAIPNDPSNLSRALRLVEKTGLISFPPHLPQVTPQDILSNPRQIHFVEMDAPQLTAVLKDVDLAVINTDWVVLASLDPSQALIQESLDSPYTNVMVVRRGEGKREEIQKLIHLYHHPDVKEWVAQEWKGAVIAAWTTEKSSQ